MVRKDTIALHLYFEVSFYKWTNLVTNIKHITDRRSVKKRIQRSREGNQLTENNDNQGEAKEVEEHNQNMAEEDYPNLFENLFD